MMKVFTTPEQKFYCHMWPRTYHARSCVGNRNSTQSAELVGIEFRVGQDSFPQFCEYMCKKYWLRTLVGLVTWLTLGFGTRIAPFQIAGIGLSLRELLRWYGTPPFCDILLKNYLYIQLYDSIQNYKIKFNFTNTFCPVIVTQQRSSVGYKVHYDIHFVNSSNYAGDFIICTFQKKN